MTDQPDYSGSCMIALYPPAEVAGALAVPDGLSAESMHVTIAYTGDAADVDPDALNAAAKALASRPAFTATISGHARFTGGEQDCIIPLADAPELETLRSHARAALSEQGIGIPSEHGFCPHLAIRYLGADEDDPVGRLASFPVTFGAVSAVHGKDRTDYPFDDGIGPLAAEAFTAGYVLHGQPVTGRARAACSVAVATAIEHADDPDVLEVTLQIGKLEGAWAKVFARREALIADHAAKIQAIWCKAAKRLDAGQMVRSFRQQAGMTREARDPWVDILRAEAIAAAAGMLNGIRYGPEFDDLVAAIELSLAAATAEGQTAALAVAAEMAGHDGFDWALAYDHMYEPLTHLEDLPGMGDAWVQSLIDGSAGDIGRSLASLASDGGTYDEMLASVSDLTAGDSIRAVQVLIDYAMSGSANQGALNLYASEGVTAYDVLTAGDTRVCPRCQGFEDGNPHDLSAGTQPLVPGHPLCVIGSTRVSVPGAVVAADEALGLSPDPAFASGGHGGDGRLATTTTVTEAGRDFGRGNIRAVTDREYVGDLITIRTALGHELTATPNHPVATRRGWVPIAELTVGDHVLSSTRAEWEIQAIDPDVDNVPPRIEEVAQAFPVLFDAVPVAAEDFHGDGAGSYVCVIRADRLLMDDVVPALPEQGSERQLGSRDVPVSATLVSQRDPDLSLHGPLSSPHSVMSSLGEPGALLGRRPIHAHLHGSAAAPGLNTLAEQRGTDRSPADAVDFCESLLAVSGEVTADEVVGVRRNPFSGHVYNLDTVGGWYIGNGIVTHNCRCATAPSVSSRLPFAAFAQFLTQAA